MPKLSQIFLKSRPVILFAAFFLLPHGLRADRVDIHWHAMEGASQYELQIRNESGIVLDRLFPQSVNSWNGSFPSGTYSYRLRALDSEGNIGPWGTATAFLVTPTPPKLLLPANQARILCRPGSEIRLKWGKTEEVTRYLVDVRSAEISSAIRVHKVVTGVEINLGALPPGSYFWQVKPVLNDARSGEDASFQVVDAKASERWQFTVDHHRLGVFGEYPSFGVSVGAQAGTAYYFPQFEAQIFTWSETALGFSYGYAKSNNGSASLMMNEILFTLKKYFGRKQFLPFGEIGLGADLFSATAATSQTHAALTGKLAAGVQWRSTAGVTIDLALGARYGTTSGITLFPVRMEGFLPAFSASVGYLF
jgi:hypothetical protein